MLTRIEQDTYPLSRFPISQYRLVSSSLYRNRKFSRHYFGSALRPNGTGRALRLHRSFLLPSSSLTPRCTAATITLY